MKVSKRFGGPVFAICAILGLAVDLPASATGGPAGYEDTIGPAGKTINGTWQIPEENLKRAFEKSRTGG